MKKMIALALALVMVFTLCACGDGGNGSTSTDTGNSTSNDSSAAGNDTADTGSGEPDPTPESDPEPTEEAIDNPYNLVTPGVLTIATSPDYAPYEFYAIADDGTPTLAGFDIALAYYIADYLGLEIDIITTNFDGVLMEVGSGNVDLGIAGLSPDPERENAMDFSDVYYAGKQAFVTNVDNAELFTDLASANQAGLEIGAQTGAIQEELAAQYSPDADIISLPVATDIVAEVVAGKLDGAYLEYDVALSYQANYPDLHIVCEVPYDAEGNVIGVNKGNAELLAAVNEAIAAALADGSFADFVAEAWELASGVTAILVDGEIVIEE